MTDSENGQAPSKRAVVTARSRPRAERAVGRLPRRFLDLLSEDNRDRLVDHLMDAYALPELEWGEHPTIHYRDRALRYSDLGGVTRAVVREIATRSDFDTGANAYPSLKRLAHDTGFAKSTVNRNLKPTEVGAWLFIAPNDGPRPGPTGHRSNLYLVTVPIGFRVPADAPESDAQRLASEALSSAAKPNGVHGDEPLSSGAKPNGVHGEDTPLSSGAKPQTVAERNREGCQSETQPIPIPTQDQSKDEPRSSPPGGGSDSSTPAGAVDPEGAAGPLKETSAMDPEGRALLDGMEAKSHEDQEPRVPATTELLAALRRRDLDDLARELSSAMGSSGMERELLETSLQDCEDEGWRRLDLVEALADDPPGPERAANAARAFMARADRLGPPPTTEEAA